MYSINNRFEAGKRKGGSEVLWSQYKLDEKYIPLKNLVCWHFLSYPDSYLPEM